MLRARTWEEACRIQFKVQRKRCSKQTAGILPRVREVDELMTPDLQARVLEGHPELSFAMMNGANPMTYRKLTKEGRVERLGLLGPHFADIERNLSRIPGGATDIIDAYACLWTARRVLRGEAVHRPPVPQLDERGLRCEIVT